MSIRSTDEEVVEPAAAPGTFLGLREAGGRIDSKRRSLKWSSFRQTAKVPEMGAIMLSMVVHSMYSGSITDLPRVLLHISLHKLISAARPMMLTRTL